MGLIRVRRIGQLIGVDIALEIEGDVDRLTLSWRFGSPDSLIVLLQGGYIREASRFDTRLGFTFGKAVRARYGSGGVGVVSLRGLDGGITRTGRCRSFRGSICIGSRWRCLRGCGVGIRCRRAFGSGNLSGRRSL